MGSGNESIVTPSLIGWVHAQNDPWVICKLNEQQLSVFSIHVVFDLLVMYVFCFLACLSGDLYRYVHISAEMFAVFSLAWLFLAATKQLYDWFSPSVRLSVCLSVCHTFFTMFPSSYHHEIFRSYYHGQKWCPCKRSRSEVKVTEVNTQLSRFRTLTPVWIHIWQWNHAHSWKQHRRGALLFFKVIRQISRSHGSKNRRIWPRLGVSGL